MGTSLITRGPGGATLDLTANYKYREGTKEERVSYKRASRARDLHYMELPEELQAPPPPPQLRTMLDAGLLFELCAEPAQLVGRRLRLAYRLMNARNVSRSVFVNLAAHAVYYTGAQAGQLLSVAEPVALAPMESRFDCGLSEVAASALRLSTLVASPH